MIDPKQIEKIARQLHESMPKSIREFSGDFLERKIREILDAQLMRLALVRCEEFNVQTQMLLRTREKLALLEQRINELENRNRNLQAELKDKDKEKVKKEELKPAN